jgi:DNA polymerase-3 subunit epsilon
MLTTFLDLSINIEMTAISVLDVLEMNALLVYQWWGESNEPPSHLKTKKQLAAMGMKPVEPVGVIPTRKYDVYLYDPGNLSSAIPKKPATSAQLQALAKGREKQKSKAAYREWYEEFGRFLRDKNQAIKWARQVLKNHADWRILDTETTGLDDAQIVQIAIINLQGETVLDSLVKPTISIPESVIAIHGITNEKVADSPTLREIYPQIVEALKEKKVTAYNLSFDLSILDYCCRLHDPTDPWAAELLAELEKEARDAAVLPSGTRVLDGGEVGGMGRWN